MKLFLSRVCFCLCFHTRHLEQVVRPSVSQKIKAMLRQKVLVFELITESNCEMLVSIVLL